MPQDIAETLARAAAIARARRGLYAAAAAR